MVFPAYGQYPKTCPSSGLGRGLGHLPPQGEGKEDHISAKSNR